MLIVTTEAVDAFSDNVNIRTSPGDNSRTWPCYGNWDMNSFGISGGGLVFELEVISCVYRFQFGVIS